MDKLEVNLEDVAQKIKNSEDIVLVDVREPWELDIVAFPGALSIPLGELRDRVEELPSDKDIILICHHGRRSLSGVAVLRAQGYEKSHSLVGGIDAWARQMDTSMAIY